jgi:hypothetical protein
MGEMYMATGAETTNGLGPVAEERKQDLLNAIISYEMDELTDEQVANLFQELHDTGLAYDLQGSYGRTAQYMIEHGLIQDTRTTSLRRAERSFTKGI